MAYFKYVSPDRLDVLTTRKIRYTQVSALNDPFEALPAIHLAIPQDDYKNFARKEIRKHTRNLPGTSPKQRKSIRRDLLRKAMEDYSAEDGDQAASHYQQKVRRITDSTTGILCLSKVPDNILMWSHYADSHRGLVIEFDSKHKYFTYGTQEVRYSKDRPAMLLNDTNPSAEIMTTKSIDWKYEQEVRRSESLVSEHIMLPEGGRIDLAPHDAIENPEEIYLFNLPNDLITGVVLGWKSTVQFREEVRKAALSIGIKPTKIRQAIPSKHEYKVDVVPMERTND